MLQLFPLAAMAAGGALGYKLSRGNVVAALAGVGAGYLVTQALFGGRSVVGAAGNPLFENNPAFWQDRSSAGWGVDARGYRGEAGEIVGRRRVVVAV